MNWLTYRIKGKKFRIFMGMNKSGWEMAPRVLHISANKTALWILNTSHCKELWTWERAFSADWMGKITLHAIQPQRFCGICSLWLNGMRVMETLKSGNSPNITITERKFRAWNPVSVNERLTWILVLQILCNYAVSSENVAPKILRSAIVTVPFLLPWVIMQRSFIPPSIFTK